MIDTTSFYLNFMGNKLERKFRVARPNEIDFPKCEKNHSVNIKIKNVINEGRAKSCNFHLDSLFLLKSGNILVATDFVDRTLCTIKSDILIYNIPDLKMLSRYTFPNDWEDENELYRISRAIQLKNGNILAIRDKFYEFDGESIKEGPKRQSGELKYENKIFAEYEFEDPLSIEKKTIMKKVNQFGHHYMTEGTDGIILCSLRDGNNILGLDSKKLDENLKNLLKDEWDLNIIFQSEYYPEHLYIIKNTREASELDIYDIKEFCNGKKKEALISNFKISESENVYGCCEYDKKYILFDTFNKGIYIFDIETKTKVAVSNLIYKVDIRNYKSYGYGKMIKLEDGQLIRWNCHLSVIDIVEGKDDYYISIGATVFFVKVDKYIVVAYPNSIILVAQIYDD